MALEERYTKEVEDHANGDCTLAQGNRFPWPAWLERGATLATAQLIHGVIIKGGNPDH